MTNVTSTQYHKFRDIEYSFVGNNLKSHGSKSFEIDIQPGLTGEAIVIKLLFSSGVLPIGASLTSEMRVGCERWKLHWTKKTDLAVQASLRRTFFQYVNSGGGHHFEAGWQRDNTKVFDRQTQERREQWGHQRRSILGGRSFYDIMKLGFGPHEIRSVGFVWYGPVRSNRTYEVQTYPYSDSSDFNQAIRYFLERGLSLKEALNINRKQMKNLNDQAIIALGLTMLGGAGGIAQRGGPPISFFKELKEVALAVTNNPKNPLTPNTKGLFETVTAQFRNAPIEKKVQSLSKMKPVKIPIL